MGNPRLGDGQKSARSQAPAMPGDTLAGKYRIEREIGSGGMGAVYRAQHMALGQACAIKFLLPGAGHLPDATPRFLREARATAMLQSAHVVRVHDVGVTDDEVPYLVMELLEGEDVGRLLESRGALSIQETADLLIQACDAISEAHAAGIVHRDLKPQNLFLAQRKRGTPVLKVLDFGLSKIRNGVLGIQSDITRTSAVVGSAAYMSPEQLRGLKDTGPASDIWSLGVVLYELVAGRRPFDMKKVHPLVESPTSIRLFRTGVPRAIESLLQDCLQRDVAQRPASAEEVASRLAPFASKHLWWSVEVLAATREASLESEARPEAGDPGEALSTIANGNPAEDGSIPVDEAISRSGPVAESAVRWEPSPVTAPWPPEPLHTPEISGEIAHSSGSMAEYVSTPTGSSAPLPSPTPLPLPATPRPGNARTVWGLAVTATLALVALLFVGLRMRGEPAHGAQSTGTAPARVGSPASDTRGSTTPERESDRPARAVAESTATGAETPAAPPATPSEEATPSGSTATAGDSARAALATPRSGPLQAAKTGTVAPAGGRSGPAHTEPRAPAPAPDKTASPSTPTAGVASTVPATPPPAGVKATVTKTAPPAEPPPPRPTERRRDVDPNDARLQD